MFHNFMLDALYSDELWLKSDSGNIYNDSYGAKVPTRQSTYSTYGFYNATANASFGIVVGTGTTAFHLDDFVLETKIAHGNTASCLYYQAQVAPVTAWTGNPDYDLNILHTRIFNNNSGGEIIVKEVGLIYADGAYIASLLSRDVLAAPVTVANTAQLTVSVSITTQSLSAIDAGVPAMGAYGSGGIFVGQFDYTVAEESPGSHRKYGWILATIASGGEASKKYRDPGATLATALKNYYGGDNTTAMIGLGAASEAGVWCAAQNAAALGGFTDWYIPARYELAFVYHAAGYMPAGEECSSEYYMSSTSTNTNTEYVHNPITDVPTQVAMTSSIKVRLMRRFLISSWVPV
jgi:hypothetical protein